jgi:hypothetical protein
MNTETNTPTSSAANAHNEQPSADTKKYCVVLRLAEISEFAVCIEASSRAEAVMRAEINAAKNYPDCGQSGRTCYDVSYLSVEPVEGGKVNE